MDLRSNINEILIQLKSNLDAHIKPGINQFGGGFLVWINLDLNPGQWLLNMLQKLDDSATNSRHYRLLNIHQKLDDLGIITSRDYFIGLFGSLMYRLANAYDCIRSYTTRLSVNHHAMPKEDRDAPCLRPVSGCGQRGLAYRFPKEASQEMYRPEEYCTTFRVL
jgi:hypothetical protein